MICLPKQNDIAPSKSLTKSNLKLAAEKLIFYFFCTGKSLLTNLNLQIKFSSCLCCGLFLIELLPRFIGASCTRFTFLIVHPQPLWAVVRFVLFTGKTEIKERRKIRTPEPAIPLSQQLLLST